METVSPGLNDISINLDFYNYKKTDIVDVKIENLTASFSIFDDYSNAGNTISLDEGIEMSKTIKQTGAKEAKKVESEITFMDVLDASQTFGLSVFSGISKAGETILDGVIVGVGQVDSLAYKAASLFNKYILNNDNKADELWKKSQTRENKYKEIVETDLTGLWYKKAVSALDINEEIAYGKIHSYTQTGAQIATVLVASVLTMGAAAAPGASVSAAAAFNTMTALGAASAAGSTAETAYNNGASFWEGAVAADVAGGMAVASGTAMKNIGLATQGVTTVKEGAKLAGESFIVGASSPLVGSATSYGLYGKDMVDNDGNKIYDNFGDYFIETGGLQSSLIGGSVAAISTSVSAAKSYKTNENIVKKELQELEETRNLQEYKDAINEEMDSLSKYSRRDKWQEYFDEKYGAENVESVTQTVEMIEFNNKLNNMTIDERGQAWEEYFLEKYNSDTEWLSEHTRTYVSYAKETGVGTSGRGIVWEDVPDDVKIFIKQDNDVPYGYVVKSREEMGTLLTDEKIQKQYDGIVNAVIDYDMYDSDVMDVMHEVRTYYACADEDLIGYSKYLDSHINPDTGEEYTLGEKAFELSTGRNRNIKSSRAIMEDNGIQSESLTERNKKQYKAEPPNEQDVETIKSFFSLNSSVDTTTSDFKAFGKFLNGKSKSLYDTSHFADLSLDVQITILEKVRKSAVTPNPTINILTGTNVKS